MEADVYGEWENIDTLTSDLTSCQRMTLAASHLLQAWDRCSLSADFWARYTALSVPVSELPGRLRREVLVNKVSYLLNELFENCAKFSQGSPGEVQYFSWLFSDRFVFEIRNHIHPDQKKLFATRIEELLKEDPDKLYLQKMAEDSGDRANDTGLGYLTLMKDDDIHFGFRFFPVSDATMTVAIQAHVNIKGGMNMSDLQVKGDDYQIVYDESNRAVTFQGTMRLRAWKDYAPMSELLRSAYDTVGENSLILTLDFRQLRFLNSSGIHALCKFVIETRKEDRPGIRVLGNPDFYWQHRSLANLAKLWPKVQVDFG